MASPAAIISQKAVAKRRIEACAVALQRSTTIDVSDIPLAGGKRHYERTSDNAVLEVRQLIETAQLLERVCEAMLGYVPAVNHAAGQIQFHPFTPPVEEAASTASADAPGQDFKPRSVSIDRVTLSRTLEQISEIDNVVRIDQFRARELKGAKRSAVLDALDARERELSGELTIKPAETDEESDKPADDIAAALSLTAPEIIAMVAESDYLGGLRLLLMAEQNGRDRITVTRAMEARIAQLESRAQETTGEGHPDLTIDPETGDVTKSWPETPAEQTGEEQTPPPPAESESQAEPPVEQPSGEEQGPPPPPEQEQTGQSQEGAA